MDIGGKSKSQTASREVLIGLRNILYLIVAEFLLELYQH